MVKPKRVAPLMALSIPNAFNSRIETRLRELYNALRRRIGPKNSSPEFSGRHVPSRLLSSKTRGESLIKLAAVKPFSSAVV